MRSMTSVLSVDVDYRSLIRKALEGKAKGDLRGYHFVLAQLSANCFQERYVIPLVWLQALKQFASSITPNNCPELMQVLFSFEWGVNEEGVVDAFVDLLLNMVSANGLNTSPCFQMLVQNLYPRKDSVGRKHDLKLSNVVATRVHKTIQLVLQLVPTSPALLYEVLTEKFPHKIADAEVQKLYLANVLAVIEYCPILKGALLGLAVNQILQLDVEIKLDYVAEDDEDENEVQFEMEMTAEGQFRTEEIATKLDVMMDLVFGYLSTVCEKGSAETRQEIFNVMLNIFDAFILKTHRSKYTQFLLFYVCRMDATFRRDFLGYLLNKLLDTSNHVLTRRTCCAYAGSFIARAAFLTPSLVEECLNVMARCCHNYLNTHEGKNPDAEVHALFYSVCQSIFYIYCFKHNQLLDGEKGKEHFRQLQLERLIQSSLNPFKFCLSTVVTEFVRITENLHLLSCQDILAKNKKLVLPTKSIFGGANQLESFFPFDPYLLRHSSRYLQGLYQNWSQPDDNKDDDEHESGSLTEEDEAEASLAWSNSIPVSGSLDTFADGMHDMTPSEGSVDDLDFSMKFSWERPLKSASLIPQWGY